MKSRIPWWRSLLATLLLIVLVVAASFVVTGRVNRMEVERSFERLHQEASALAKEIVTQKNNEQEQLKLLASVAAGWENLDSPELWQLLDSFFPAGTMSRAEILLPGDMVITQGGRRVDVQGLLSFDVEAPLGIHISGRSTDWQEDGGYVVRHFVPVEKGGKTVALLYGVVDLRTLPAELAAEPYGGQAALYIIEGQTGDFLVDTWHNEPGGNIWALGERKMEPGYNHEQLKQGLIDGQEGYVVFLSETAGERLYFYYEPIAVNQWRIALSVPEKVVFSSAKGIRDILTVFLVVEGVGFFLYFLWMLRFVRRATNEKQRQLDTLNEIYDVEKLLFNAHEQKDNMRLALEKIARMNRAEGAGVWTRALPEAQGVFLWNPAGDAMAGMTAVKTSEALQEYFGQGEEMFTAASPEELQKKLPGAGGLRSLLAVPAEDGDRGICGVLAVWNIAEKVADPAVLKSLEFSFSRFCHNLQTYQAIKAQGETDLLSGLNNRNRYEMDLSHLPLHSLACIYLDANGLHELNNAQGHEAGDRMLREVAGQLREKFGSRYTYRIGGDEFLAFAPDAEEQEVARRCRELELELEREGYAVSIGFRWEARVDSAEVLVKAAEQKMYAAKRAYYQQEAHDRRRGERSTGIGDAEAGLGNGEVPGGGTLPAPPGAEAAKPPAGAEGADPPAYTEDWELLDVVDGNGFPTGRTVTRKVAHARGIRHRTAHVWLVRRRGEKLEVLLQKRSAEKDAYPGCYDISSAGHVPAGSGYLDSAVRELREELGVEADPRELHYCGRRWVYQEDWFRNAPFVDNQVSQVYLLWRDLEPEQLTLQREEVESVCWMELEQCRQWVREGRMKTCIANEELDLLAGALYGWKKRTL